MSETPIFDELSFVFKTVQESAFTRGKEQIRIEMLDFCKEFGKPSKQIIEVIRRLEQLK